MFDFLRFFTFSFLVVQFIFSVSTAIETLKVCSLEFFEEPVCLCEALEPKILSSVAEVSSRPCSPQAVARGVRLPGFSTSFVVELKSCVWS